METRRSGRWRKAMGIIATSIMTGTGSVAIFHVWALWSELDPIGGGLGGQRRELLSHREALGSRRDHQLPFLEHMHEFYPGEGTLGGLK